MLTDLLQEMGLLPDPVGHTRPVVGASACLLGRPVRHDGGHRFDAFVGDTLTDWFQLRGCCPEVGIGLPVPRAPIQVVDTEIGQRVRGVDCPRQDVTSALRDFADRIAGPLDGFILKARSPSCGLGTTVLHDTTGHAIGTTSGAFAARLRQRFAHMPLCNDTDLDDEEGRAAFIAAVYSRHRDGQLPGRIPARIRRRMARFQAR